MPLASPGHSRPLLRQPRGKQYTGCSKSYLWLSLLPCSLSPVGAQKLAAPTLLPCLGSYWHHSSFHFPWWLGVEYLLGHCTGGEGKCLLVLCSFSPGPQHKSPHVFSAALSWWRKWGSAVDTEQDEHHHSQEADAPSFHRNTYATSGQRPLKKGCSLQPALQTKWKGPWCLDSKWQCIHSGEGAVVKKDMALSKKSIKGNKCVMGTMLKGRLLST